MPIGPPAALTLGPILYELATNAVEYGAPSRLDGYVVLEWKIQGEGTEAKLRLIWSEHGGPSVTLPQRKGFGPRLIGHGLGGGMVEVRYRMEGVIRTLTTPLANLRVGT